MADYTKCEERFFPRLLLSTLCRVAVFWCLCTCLERRALPLTETFRHTHKHIMNNHTTANAYTYTDMHSFICPPRVVGVRPVAQHNLWNKNEWNGTRNAKRRKVGAKKSGIVVHGRNARMCSAPLIYCCSHTTFCVSTLLPFTPRRKL